MADKISMRPINAAISYKKMIGYILPSYRFYRRHLEWAMKREECDITPQERAMNAHDNEIYYAEFMAQCELAARIFASVTDMDALVVMQDVKSAYKQEQED